MGETTLVKADKQLVKQSRELGANVRRIVDLALEDYIKRNMCLKPEIKVRKGPFTKCNGGTLESDLSEEIKTYAPSAYHSSSDLGNPNSSSLFSCSSISKGRRRKNEVQRKEFRCGQTNFNLEGL